MYPAFVLLLLYGLRRGEVLGLRWRDIDEDDREIRIRQQVHRSRGALQLGPVKTAAGRRDQPLLPLAAEALAIRAQAQEAPPGPRASMGGALRAGLHHPDRTAC